MSTPPSVCKKVDKAQAKVLNKSRQKTLKAHILKTRNSCNEIKLILNSNENFVLIEMPYFLNDAINEFTYSAEVFFKDSLTLSVIKSNSLTQDTCNTKLGNFNQMNTHNIDLYEETFCYWGLLNSDFNYEIIRKGHCCGNPRFAIFTVYNKGEIKSFLGHYNPCNLDLENPN